LCSGQKATTERVAEAIAENKAELVHIPSAINLPTPLPTKDCPSCDGTVSVTFFWLQSDYIPCGDYSQFF